MSVQLFDPQSHVCVLPNPTGHLGHVAACGCGSRWVGVPARANRAAVAWRPAHWWHRAVRALRNAPHIEDTLEAL